MATIDKANYLKDTKEILYNTLVSMGADITRLTPLKDYSAIISSTELEYSPSVLFADGSDGFYFDFSDRSTMYQDYYANQPVTEHGQPVGFILDKSRNLELGEELWNWQTPIIQNGGGAGGVWDSVTKTMSNTVAGTTANYPRFRFNLGLLTNNYYLVQFKISGEISGSKLIQVRLTAEGTVSLITFDRETGVGYGIAPASNGAIEFTFGNVLNSGVTIEEMSIRRIRGRHARQSTASARPLFARMPSTGVRNTFTYSSLTGLTLSVSGAATVNPSDILDPMGGTDGLKIGYGDALSYVTRGLNTSFNEVTFSCWVKGEVGKSVVIVLNTNSSSNKITTTDGTISSANTSYAFKTISLTGEWQRVSMWITCPTPITNGFCYFGDTRQTSHTATLVYWFGAQIEQGVEMTPYQSVGAGVYDVTEDGVESIDYCYFDRSNDALVVPYLPSGTTYSNLLIGKTGGTYKDITRTDATFNIGVNSIGGDPELSGLINVNEGRILRHISLMRPFEESEVGSLNKYAKSIGSSYLLDFDRSVNYFTGTWDGVSSNATVTEISPNEWKLESTSQYGGVTVNLSPEIDSLWHIDWSWKIGSTNAMERLVIEDVGANWTESVNYTKYGLSYNTTKSGNYLYIRTGSQTTGGDGYVKDLMIHKINKLEWE